MSELADLGLHQDEAKHLVADKPSSVVVDKNLAWFWIFCCRAVLC